MCGNALGQTSNLGLKGTPNLNFISPFHVVFIPADAGGGIWLFCVPFLFALCVSYGGRKWGGNSEMTQVHPRGTPGRRGTGTAQSRRCRRHSPRGRRRGRRTRRGTAHPQGGVGSQHRAYSFLGGGGERHTPLPLDALRSRH